MAHKVFFVIGRGKLLLGVGRRQQQGRAFLSPWLLLSVTGDIRMCQLIRVQAKKKRVAWKSVRSIQTWKRRLEEWVSALERSGCCLINSDASIFSRRSFALGTRRGKNNLLLPFRVLVNEKKRDSTLVVLVEIDLFPSIFTWNNNLFLVSFFTGIASSASICTTSATPTAR